MCYFFNHKNVTDKPFFKAQVRSDDSFHEVSFRKRERNLRLLSAVEATVAKKLFEKVYAPLTVGGTRWEMSELSFFQARAVRAIMARLVRCAMVNTQN